MPSSDAMAASGALPFLHSGISHVDGEDLLRSSGNACCFLVREVDASRRSYALCVLEPDSPVVQLPLAFDKTIGKYTLSGRSYGSHTTIKELVAYLKSPKSKDSGFSMKLGKPVLRSDAQRSPTVNTLMGDEGRSRSGSADDILLSLPPQQKLLQACSTRSLDEREETFGFGFGFDGEDVPMSPVRKATAFVLEANPNDCLTRGRRRSLSMPLDPDGEEMAEAAGEAERLELEAKKAEDVASSAVFALNQAGRRQSLVSQWQAMNDLEGEGEREDTQEAAPKRASLGRNAPEYMHGCISRELAEERLVFGGLYDGKFLLREQEDGTQILSVLSDRLPAHFRITCDNLTLRFKVNGKSYGNFSTVEELLEGLKGADAKERGWAIRLKYHVKRPTKSPTSSPGPQRRSLVSVKAEDEAMFAIRQAREAQEEATVSRERINSLSSGRNRGSFRRHQKLAGAIPATAAAAGPRVVAP